MQTHTHTHAHTHTQTQVTFHVYTVNQAVCLVDNAGKVMATTKVGSLHVPPRNK
jgi:hypothetical protein